MNARTAQLLPGGVPRWVRCYDNGGASFDRYTVCFTGRTGPGGRMFLSMSAHPCHPQGFGQHDSARHPIDANPWGYAPAMGRKCHLGTRVPFSALPEDCQSLVLSDYREIWRIKP